MDRFNLIGINHQKKINHYLILILTIVLLLLASIYLIKGFYTLTLVDLKQDGAKDLFSRWQEQQYIYQGLYPYDINKDSPNLDPNIGPITSGGYLPWSFFTGFFLIPKISWPAIRIYHAFLNFIALGVISLFAYKIGLNYGRLRAGLFVASVLAISSNCTTLNLGQYGLIINALLCGVFWGLEANKKTATGILFGLAMVKPNISAMYFFILVFKKKFQSLIVFFLYMLVANLVISWQLQRNPISLVNRILQQSKYFSDKGTSAIDLGVNLGLETQLTVLVMIVISGILVSGIFYLLRNYSLLTFFAIACVTGRVFTYHLYYDNVMLVFLLIALLNLACGNPNKLNIFMYLLVGITLWIPASLRRMGGETYEIIEIVIWCLSLVYLIMAVKFNNFSLKANH